MLSHPGPSSISGPSACRATTNTTYITTSLDVTTSRPNFYGGARRLRGLNAAYPAGYDLPASLTFTGAQLPWLPKLSEPPTYLSILRLLTLQLQLNPPFHLLTNLPTSLPHDTTLRPLLSVEIRRADIVDTALTIQTSRCTHSTVQKPCW